MSTILSRVSGLRIQASAPELGNISSSDFSGRSEIRTMGMSFLLDCDLSTSLRRLPLMLGRFTSRKMMSGEVPARTWLNSIQLDAVRTVHPSRSSSARPSFRTSGLSSRINTATFDNDAGMSYFLPSLSHQGTISAHDTFSCRRNEHEDFIGRKHSVRTAAGRTNTRPEDGLASVPPPGRLLLGR